MPNWWHNGMRITGSSDEIARFKRTCVAAEQTHLDFDAIWAVPWSGQRLAQAEEPAPDAAAQAEERAACAGYQDFEVIRDEPNYYECRFDTAHIPAVHVWWKLADMFPTLDFSLRSYDLINAEAVVGTTKNGKCELQEADVIWETIDPKTGKTVYHHNLGCMEAASAAAQGGPLAFHLSTDEKQNNQDAVST